MQRIKAGFAGGLVVKFNPGHVAESWIFLSKWQRFQYFLWLSSTAASCCLPGVYLQASLIFFYNFSVAFLQPLIRVIKCQTANKTHFSPTQDKCLVIVLEQTSRNILIKICAHRPTTCRCELRHCWESLRMLQILCVFCQSEHNFRLYWSFLSLQQGLAGGSYSDM